tara:strand:- start:393 stop:620 length:228 start_codon:yes stop_codon:yes gene_type:complete
MEEHFTIDVVCLFCQATLKVEEGKELQSGDMIKCQECGEENDFDSVMEVAKEKGIAKVEAEVADELNSKFKNLFK